MSQSTSHPDPDHTHRREDAPTIKQAVGDPKGSRVETVAADPSNPSRCPDAPSATQPLVLPAELVNHPRYEILQVLGTGGMGTVYKARHRFMDRLVALKVVHSHLLDRPDVVVRFEREVHMAALLAHPNIVTAYDAEVYGSLHFLVMEFVPGENLADVIATAGPLPVRRACDYARQAAWGLRHAFQQGMIHRDIKPHNLIRTVETDAGGDNREVVKILDFGLARLVQEIRKSTTGQTSSPPHPHGELAGHETTCGDVMGTWNYMAPEQAEDAHRADIRSDIYSLGCTLYHMLLGHPPFAGRSAAQKREMHRHIISPPITDSRPDVPPGLASVVARMLAKEPAERYQTPAEVAEALTPYMDSPAGETIAAPREPAHARPDNAVQRRRLLLTGAMIGLLLLGGAGLVAYRHFSRRLPPANNQPTLIRTTESRYLKGHTGSIFGLAYSPDGASLLSGGQDGTLRIWDVATGRERRAPLRGHKGPIRGVAVAADGRRALSAGEDGTARVWNLADGHETSHFMTNPREVLTSVALCADGKHVLCGGEKNTWLWDAASGETLLRLPRWAESVAFSPDGRRAVTGGWDNTVYVWDLKSGRELHALTGHTGGVKSVMFSPDGARILSGGEDWKICLWDAVSGKMLRGWQAHKGFIWGVAFSPDGRRALSVSWDRTARLWDLNDGREIQRFTPESEELCCGALSPEGRFAACAGADRIIRLWELPP